MLAVECATTPSVIAQILPDEDDGAAELLEGCDFVMLRRSCARVKSLDTVQALIAFGKSALAANPRIWAQPQPYLS